MIQKVATKNRTLCTLQQILCLLCIFYSSTSLPPVATELRGTCDPAPPLIHDPTMSRDSQSIQRWQFAIDVGGTFCDVFARRPDGATVTCKVLSSGCFKGAAHDGSTASRIIDPLRCSDPDKFWTGWSIRFRASGHRGIVRRFDRDSGAIEFEPALSAPPRVDESYELFTDQPAPVVAIRYLMGLGLTEAIGSIDVRLGSTRATNALLERKGAHTVLVTTAGFADLLQIGYQDRPKLFDLNIRKPSQLASRVIEIHERIGPDGRVIVPLDDAEVREKLEQLPGDNPCALAICLLHAYANHGHEQRIASIARSMNFAAVSVSSEISPTQRMVPRADTTVADAYLSPVIRDYLAHIRRHVPHARLLIMTSAGGLVAADRVAAKDTLLSGPAGGVVGCAAVATAAGYDRAIGFDMGGTSTDVCRFGGAYEYQFETVKSGVRIVAPMLAVETVAAGGGSICDFDGTKLTVGPHSAAADPGPACYGAGGPLTITDVNCFLGRIPTGHFPIPLNVKAVQTRLDDLARQVSTATQVPSSQLELAKGWLAIANENMAAAIRRISVAKGYNPADYVLVSFGGAGGQHACAVARLLGIQSILLSPNAGILSAVGIAAADLKRLAERMIQAEFSAASPRLDAVFAELEGDLRRQLIDDGAIESQIQPPVRMLDMRYQGEDATITVTAPLRTPHGSGGPGDDEPRTQSEPESVGSRHEQLLEAFIAMHQQLYGYTHTGRDVEVLMARVELSAGKSTESVAGAAPAPHQPAPAEHREMVFDTGPISTPVYLRGSLTPGARFVGPAMVIERGSTTIVEPGFSASVLQTGDVLLTCTAPTGSTSSSTESDPVRLELFNNRFAAIAERMGAALRRTALSTNVKERLDYSCALFTGDGDLVANAPHMPVHLGSMGACVKAVLAEVTQLRPGDTVLTNDPLRGGTHLPDLTVVTPFFTGDSQPPRFFVASRAHHAEIGSPQPGSMPAHSRRLADEGVVIRNFKVVQGGRMRVGELRAVLTAGPYPSRSPEENIADIAAQVAANQCGITDLRDLIATHGPDVVNAYTRHVQNAAERKMRRALGGIPDGDHTFGDRLDNGSPIRVCIRKRGDSAEIDFAGTAGVHPGNFNANPAIVSSAVLYCFRCLIDEDIPLNAGVLAPLRIIIPAGILNPPLHDDPAQCAAVAAGNVETSQRVVDVLFGALGVAAASQGTMNNLIFGNERFGYYETICGGAGAGPDFDGADAVHTHMTNTRQTDPEVFESRYPVRIRKLAIRKGSGGRGRRCGGDGLIRQLEFLSPLSVSIISQRRLTQPYGLCGGQPGAPGRNLLRRMGESRDQTLDAVCTFDVQAGDVLTIETPGGGGYGS